MSAPDITRLPKWAQELIANLERDLADTRHTIHTTYDQGTTRVFIRDFLSRGGDHPLPPDTVIRFQIGDGNYDAIDVSARRSNHKGTPDAQDAVDVSAYNGILAVVPMSANRVRIYIEKDRARAGS